MANMKATIKVKRDLGPYKAGQTVHVELDADGNLTSQYWRRRLKDAEHDGCCELVGSKPPSKRKASAQKDSNKIDNPDETRGGNDE